jgi:hypothetical protein
LARNRIVKSSAILSSHQEAPGKLLEKHQGRSIVSALHVQAAIARRRNQPGGGMLAARRTERRDRLVASALLAALIIGWVANFVSVKQLSLGLSDLLAHALTRQA